MEMQLSQDIIQIAECGNYILYQKKKTSMEWFGFLLVLKHPRSKKTRFDLGWNGERLANSEALKRLLIEDERAIKCIEITYETFKDKSPFQLVAITHRKGGAWDITNKREYRGLIEESDIITEYKNIIKK